MTVSALVSGGKDSIFSAYLADSQGMTVDELVTLEPEDPESFLFHTPNLPVVALQAEAWGKRHRRVPIHGVGEVAETAALRSALSGSDGPVVTGAIASSYQWGRLHRVTFELGRPLYTPLWGKDAERVVREEIAAGLDVRLVHLAAEPLTPDLIGARLDEKVLATILARSRERRRVHPAGEGGEYETLVVDAPFFRERIILDETAEHRSADVTSLRVVRSHLAPKPLGS